MKAPDKIYLNKHMIRPGMLYPAQYPADTPEFEYIRKDALLEWAKNWQNELDDSLGASMVYHVLNEVLKKIESL